MSRHHARIDRGRDELYTIENLGANGTRLNAAQLSSRTDLHPGDRIYIEKYVLIYQPDAEARAPSDEELTELVACSASALPARRPLVDRPDAEVLSE